jgi:hypothetical protein
MGPMTFASVAARGPRARALLVGAVAGLAIAPAGASAHTSAVCDLTGHAARCTGSVANRPITLGNATGTMTLRSSYGRLRLVVAPMMSFSTPPMAITTNLTCVMQSDKPSCIGMAKVARELVLVATSGDPAHDTVVISLSDGISISARGDARHVRGQTP